jgi:plastocyanin
MSLARFVAASAASALLFLAACGGAERGTTDTTAAAPATPATPAAPAPGGAVTPAPGGQIITVEMETQPDGSNVFEPSTVEAKQGDVLRYVLVSGVHNVHFLPDSNPGKANLPPASALLQLPGQTHDIKVEMAPGSYYFQCDPHALLGMIGRLTVTQ